MLGVAVEADVSGVAGVVDALGAGVSMAGGVGAGLLAVDEVSLAGGVVSGDGVDALREETDEGSELDGTDGLLFAVVRVLFVVVVVFAGALSSRAATFAREVGSGVATAVLAAGPESDTAGEEVVDSSVAAGAVPESATFEVGAVGTATSFVLTSWLNANAPSTTMAMITPNAIGKCFTEASCWVDSHLRTGAARAGCA